MAEGQVTDQSPIINQPYAEPARHWHFEEGSAPVVREGRRASGYLPPGGEGELAITGDLVHLDLVNDLRGRVRRWREEGYPAATAVTRDLLDRWFDPDREAGTRPFFAQQEALETVVFLAEAPADRRVGVSIPMTEAYQRWAVKMATGTGKTLVMAMVVSWSVLNKAASPTDTRFADAALVVCPNLTVKERLSGLDPHRVPNEYETFGLIPPNLAGLMGQARVMVTNWHAMAPETDPRRSVLRRGEESDAAFCRRVIEAQLGKKRRLLVINDEAHHAYRHRPEAVGRREEKDEAERATVWVDGLARVHRDREVLRCVDFSATPMYLPGTGHAPWTPFEWVVSDFALVDAIESGLVKIPRMPVDDNAGTAVPKYCNLWEHVKANLPRARDEADTGSPLTDYLTQVDGPLRQLAGEWQETFERWRQAGRPVPPCMIVICNDTKMAELLEDHVGRKGQAGPALQNPLVGSSRRTVRIDSRLLAEAEAKLGSAAAADAAEAIRRVVATVGKPGEPGQDVRCLISVAMLSEGWDARNVTQVLGLRAFSSQLLCEQVVGRGLRRSSYDDLSVPEYVDVYGVPFQLLPFAKADPATVAPPPRTTSVVALRARRDLEITFPRVTAIVVEIGSQLVLDFDSIPAILVDPENDPTRTGVAFGPGFGADQQTHAPIWERYRRQRVCFDLAARLIKGQPELASLFPQALRAVDRVLEEKVTYAPGVPPGEVDTELYKSQIADRMRAALRPVGHDDGNLLPVLDEFQPMGSTATVAFSTAKPVEPTTRSHVSHVVCDSELERAMTAELEADPRVQTYVKNDHLFCEIPYRFNGRTLRYLPDFLVRVGSGPGGEPGSAGVAHEPEAAATVRPRGAAGAIGGRWLLMEGKGRETAKDHHKEAAAYRWVAAVNADGRWGRWSHHVVRSPAEVRVAIDAAV